MNRSESLVSSLWLQMPQGSLSINTSLVFVLVFVTYIGDGPAQTNGRAAKVGSQTTTSDRDGQHDFDLALGNWKAYLKRLEHPLTGSKTWVEFGLLCRMYSFPVPPVRPRVCQSTVARL